MKKFYRKWKFEILFLLFFFCGYGIVGTIEYKDEVSQLEFNCSSATFAADNVFISEEK